MTAVLGVALIGSAALAVDVSVWEGNLGTMQGAADQAALAAGLAMSAGKDVAQNEAKGVAAAHGFVDKPPDVGVKVNMPPRTGDYTSNPNAIEVVITQSQTSFLSGVLPQSPPVATVRGVAVPASAFTCLLMLGPGTGITASGNGGINASNCNIYVNSRDACDVSLSGNSSVTGFDVFLGEQSQSGCSKQNSQPVSATNKLQLGAAPALDPYGSRTIPKPPTPCQPANISPNVPLIQGTYCGLTLSGSQSLTLKGGVYIFDGGGLNISQNAQLTGREVTLVFTSSGSSYGGIIVSGNATVDLTPMTSGATAGMAIWLDQVGEKPVRIDQNAYFNITGAVYAPRSAVTWSGNANSSCMQLIAYRTTFDQNAVAFKHYCSAFQGVTDVASAAGYKLLE